MKGSEFDSEREKENFIKMVEELKDIAVIVEGRKDAKALENLGLHDIIPINGMPLPEFASRVARHIAGTAAREVIILTDFDKKGRELERRLEALLRSHNVRANARLRRVLMRFGKGRIEDFKHVSI